MVVPSQPIATVIGAGVTGARVAGYLAAAGARVAVVDRRADAARRVAQLVDGAATELDAAWVSDVVVLALPPPHERLVRAAIAARVDVVSISDDLDDVRAVLSTDAAARAAGVSVVAGAAMSPGLSGLLARLLADRLDVVDEIHIAFHGTGGPACARQHHDALGGSSLGYHDGEWIARPAGVGRELCWFPEPVNSYDCYRAEMADPLLLQRVFPALRRASARMSANRRDRFTARLPMLSPPHREGGVGAVRVEVRGSLPGGSRETFVAGVAVRAATGAAITAATMGGWLLEKEAWPGVIVAGDERLPTARLLERIRGEAPLYEFTGQPAVR
jgi:saccharopine dehydrogenase-like NADP-dependent oxidoreductase